MRSGFCGDIALTLKKVEKSLEINEINIPLKTKVHWKQIKGNYSPEDRCYSVSGEMYVVKGSAETESGERKPWNQTMIEQERTTEKGLCLSVPFYYKLPTTKP